MRITRLVALTALLIAITTGSAATANDGPAPPVLETKIVSVGLFKNGLAVVRRTASIPADGTWEIRDVPQPVHGTLWLTCNATVETRVTSREIERSIDGRTTGSLDGDLDGRRVAVHFRNGTTPLTGTVASATKGGRFLVLDTDAGRQYLDWSIVERLHVPEPVTTLKSRVPALQVAARGVGRRPATLEITYLSKGLSWAPSYRVDVSDSTVLSVEQQAIVRNELEDLAGVEVELISGFPSVEFAHVTSPLAPTSTLDLFFSQLNQRQPNRNGQPVMSQAIVAYNAAPAGDGAAANDIVPTGEGVDLHYQPIGARRLDRGDALMISVAKGQSEYQRIIEWMVPDTRKPDGRFVDEWRRNQDPAAFEETVWDAIRFRNPLGFPMTTAPAMVVSGEHFNGQRTIHWVNPGEEATLRITRALSIRTRATEVEEPGDREIVNIGGNRYRKPLVRGELLVCNHRDERATVVIRRRFSGDLVEADGSPKQSLREDGVYSVNQRSELTWTIDLAPGEERTLGYRYSVLVLH